MKYLTWLWDKRHLMVVALAAVILALYWLDLSCDESELKILGEFFGSQVYGCSRNFGG